MDVYLKNSMNQLDPENIEGQLKHIIDASVGLMQFLPNTSESVEEDNNESSEEGWI